MQETYNGGYTKALLDVKSFFEQNSYTLKECRLYNQKGVIKVLEALIKSRKELRETGSVKSLKYNKERGEFVYDTERTQKGIADERFESNCSK